MKEKKPKNKTAIIIASILFAWLLLYGIASIFDKKSISLENKIAIVPILGEITISGSSGFPIDSQGASSTRIIKNLETAENDANVKAIILEINSPGGTVVASEEVANKIKSIDKPVVAWIREIGTSGAYWIASSSDYIIADPLSITGSIGVIGSYLEFSKLLEKYGVKYESLTTGRYKDLTSPFKELTPDERSLMQSKLNIIHNAFVEEVANNRNLPREKASEIASGIFYLGNEALQLGLIDALGNKQSAIEKAKNLAGIEDAELVTYAERKSFIEVVSQLLSYPSYYLGRGIGFELSNSLNNPRLEISAI